MKKVILLALLMPFPAFGQIVENFEAGTILNWVQSSGDRWEADTETPISGEYSLHHSFDNPEAGTDRIGVPLTNLHPLLGITRWSFLVRHGYDPSASNNWAVFLMSDTEPSAMSADGGTNGFAIGVNIMGSDDTLRLWKIKGNTLTTVINCRINWQTTIGINDASKIFIERSPEGDWTISVFRFQGSTITTNTAKDSELFTPAWFGIMYRYSSSRDRQLWIDDVSIDGNFKKDEEAPLITGIKVKGTNMVEIVLNEEPSKEFIIPANFSLNSKENRSASVTQKSALTWIIKFTDSFINKTLNNLIINLICDNCDNCAQDIIVQFNPVWAETGDVIISEIMADPLPQVYLPGKEYLELTNRTGYPFNLNKWILSTAGQNIVMPETTIKPHEILILCLAQDTSLFVKYGRSIGLKQFPALSDDGKIVYLADSSGNLIHGVEYSSAWYGTQLKSSGGWSLEMIDPLFPFFEKGNWIASSSPQGGTPGACNSVSHSNPDTLFYGLQNVFPNGSSSITVRFSEPVISLPGGIEKIMINGKSITDLSPVDLLCRLFTVTPADPLLPGVIYQLDISGDIKDFAGNGMLKTSYAFGLPESATKGDLLFNEILFNPLPADPRYIEFYNNSEKVFDATQLQLISVNDGTGDTSQIYRVSEERRCIIPGAYYAITIDLIKASERYFSADDENLFEIATLPSMPDDMGHLILLNRELEKIDEVFYSEKMHSTLLEQFEGIAIEKINPQYRSEEEINWHSASESSGWGTPGALNSFKDINAPVVVNCEPSGLNSVRIIFDEELLKELNVPDNFSLNQAENKAVSIVRISSLAYIIEFADGLINKSLNILIICTLCDSYGNCEQDIQIHFTPLLAERGDIIISEIMADPLPKVSLPGKEYLEITNRTEFSFNLMNWELSSDDQKAVIPETVIGPGEIMIICSSQDTSLFRIYGRVIGLKQFLSLTDGGRIICLSDSSRFLIHGVDYSSDWYQNDLKSEGGWSLEIIDKGFPFYYDGNWIASKSRSGGTPGSVNSVSQSNPDISFTGIQNVFADDKNKITVRFSEPVPDIQKSIGGIKIGGKSILSDLLPSDPLFREFSVKPADPLQNGEIYQFDISGDIKDFAGNRALTKNYSFGLTETPDPGDIMFNELLFNPLPGDPDYIELFNSSEKILDASRLQFVSVSMDMGDTSQVNLVSDVKRCIIPGAYYAVTIERKKISERYFCADEEYIFETGSLPSMSDDEGHLVLLNKELEVVDEVYYNEKMHYSLLTEYEGIALEKISPQYRSEEAVNWHSASESSGWGTPGARNSVFTELPETSDKVVFSSSKISPDSDGYEDFLVIQLNLTGNGNIVSVIVFDETGSFVKKIAGNLLAGPGASVIWDGTADDGSPVNTGIYIIFITLYDDTGKTNKWKKVCTVIKKSL